MVYIASGEDCIQRQALHGSGVGGHPLRSFIALIFFCPFVLFFLPFFLFLLLSFIPGNHIWGRAEAFFFVPGGLSARPSYDESPNRGLLAFLCALGGSRVVWFFSFWIPLTPYLSS